METIYNAMKKRTKNTLLELEKNDQKNFCFQEKYRYYINEKSNIYEKEYYLLSNFYEEKS